MRYAFVFMVALMGCDQAVDGLNNTFQPDVSVRDRAIQNLVFQTEREAISPFNRKGAACIADAATEDELLAMSRASSRSGMFKVIEPIRGRAGVPECQISLLGSPLTIEPI